MREVLVIGVERGSLSEERARVLAEELGAIGISAIFIQGAISLSVVTIPEKGA